MPDVMDAKALLPLRHAEIVTEVPATADNILDATTIVCASPNIRSCTRSCRTADVREVPTSNICARAPRGLENAA
jgi:hypothetical protein